MPLYDRGFASILAALRELAGRVVGEDPRQPERLWAKLNPGLFGGVAALAVAAIDVAVWDLNGKAAGLPLWRLLGGHRRRIPAYASLRLGREHPLDKLPDMAAGLLQEGFRAMKMNLGAEASIEAELARVRAVRGAIDQDVRLLVDVNFHWTPAQAVRTGRALEEFDLFWLEDPVPTHDLEGLGEVRAALRIPIAAGEALYGLQHFRPLLRAGAASVAMPDLARVGGITPFMKVAHLAEAYGLPLASHLLPEISAHAVAAAPNGLIVEYVPFAMPLFRGCPELIDGDLLLSERPGHGLELDEDFARAHVID
jgi:L-alanine-DL-glutamate epimerase-like enolase superfamily enzyme